MTSGTTFAAGGLLVRFAGDALVDTQLICFPYAGGGAQGFRDWQALLPSGVGVTGICLPGREQRFRERALDTWPDVLAALVAAVAPEAERGQYAFFGHCLGARLAYELTHRLAAGGLRPPQVLIVSACRAPGVASRWPLMHSMDSPTLTEQLRQLNGVPAEVLANRKVMALLEPVLRADLRLAETWPASPGRISAPIQALCGERDYFDPCADMLDWQHHTTGGFANRSFPAGHFFLQEQAEAVTAVIAAELRARRAV